MEKGEDEGFDSYFASRGEDSEEQGLHLLGEEDDEEEDGDGMKPGQRKPRSRSDELSAYDKLLKAPAEPDAREDPGKRKVVGLWSMVMIMFFTVCGGPIGSEEVISAGGPGIGIACMFIFPLVYCFPVSLVSAELATVFPEDGSFTLWVGDCFGRFWAFQDGYWSWISGVLDSAMYPALAAGMMLGDTEGRSAIHAWLTTLLALLASVLNFLGVRIVGRAMIFLGIFVMAPYVVMVLLWSGQFLTHGPMHGVPQTSGSVNPKMAMLGNTTGENVLGPSTPKPIYEDDLSGWHPDYLELLHVVFWSYSGWDSVSTFAGEVKNPKRTFPLALLVAIFTVSMAYLGPLGVGLVFPGSPHWSTWKEGSFLEIGFAVGGKVLRDLIALSSAISLLAMYCAEMFIDSFLLLGMAEQGLAPRIFEQRDARFDSPYASLLVNNCLTCLSVLIELFAAIIIRFRQPSGRKVAATEFRAPLSNYAVLAMLIPPIVIVFLVVMTTVFMAEAIVQVFVLALLGMGVFLFYLMAVEDLRTD